MTWVRIDDHVNEHHKILAAGIPASWLWLCGLAYCNRQKAHDGKIPGVQIRGLCSLMSLKESRKYARKLVEVGLWIDSGLNDGSVIIHDYHNYQPRSSNELGYTEKRKMAGSLGGLASASSKSQAKLKQNPSKSQAKLKQTSSKGSEAPSRPDPDPDPDLTNQEPPVAPQPATAVSPPSGKLPDGVVNCSRNDWVAAYERTVSAVRGTPWSFPKKAFDALRSVVETFCIGDDRKDIQAWIEKSVEAFVRGVLAEGEDQAKFWSGFGPDGLQRWHNESRKHARTALSEWAGMWHVHLGMWVDPRDGKRYARKEDAPQ